MMKTICRLGSAFRAIGVAACLALAALAAPSAYAVDAALTSLRYSQSNDFGRAEAQFKVDLAHQADLAGDLNRVVDTSLVRDSHGFRQVTAEFEPVATAKV